MRASPTKAAQVLSLSSLAFLAYRVFCGGEAGVKPCDLPLSQLERLEVLVGQVHTVLTQLRITHALCYESLLGQVQHGRGLPWESSGSMCVLESELERHLERDLAAAFQGAGLAVSWDSAEGRYLVSGGQGTEGRVRLVVYSAGRQLQEVLEPTLHRVGWRRKPLPANCEFSPSLSCLPARLLAPPLPLKRFGAAGSLPVPREGPEVLKYQYPDSWWKDSKPDHC